VLRLECSVERNHIVARKFVEVSFEDVVIEAWRRTLVENTKVVVLGVERYPESFDLAVDSRARCGTNRFKDPSRVKRPAPETGHSHQVMSG
jgi:hypothetical protein